MVWFVMAKGKAAHLLTSLCLQLKSWAVDVDQNSQISDKMAEMGLTVSGLTM